MSPIYKQPNRGKSSRGDGMYEDEPNSLVPTGGQSARDASNKAEQTLGDINSLLDEPSSPQTATPTFDASEAGGLGSSEKSLSPSAIEDQEADAGAGATETDDGIPFREEKKKKLTGAQLRRRGLIVGLLGLAGGGGIFGFGILSGPAMVIQYGEALAHIKPFQHQNNASDSRLTRALRWARTKDVGETRINGLESSFNRWTVNDFAKRGITLVSDKTTGQFAAVELDTSKFPQYDGLSAEEKIKAVASQLGIDPSRVKNFGVSLERGGTSNLYRGDITGLDYSGKNTLLGSFVETGNYGKISGAVRLWSMKLRFNLSNPWLHPLRAGAGKLDQKVADYARAKLANADEDSRLKKLISPSAETKAKIAAWREQTKSIQKGAAISLVATAVACTVKEIAHSIPEINRTTVVVPAMLSALDGQALAGQTEDNQSPILQLGAVATEMKGKDGSMPYQSEVYSGVTAGKDTSDLSSYTDSGTLSAFQANSTAASIDQGLNDIGIGALCSTVGQFIQVVAGTALLLTGAGGVVEKSLQLAVGVGAGFVLGDIVKSITQSLSDNPLQTLPHQGKQGGTIDALGDLELANSVSRTMGGTQLSMPQVAELDSNTPNDFATQSFASRMFNVHDYRSLSSRLMQTQNPDGTQNVASAFSGALTSFTKLGNVFSGIADALVPHAAAAPSTPYGLGIPEFGFSQADLNNPLVANPYDNAQHVAQLLDSSSGQSYIDKARACFDVTIAKDSDGKWDVTAPTDDAKEGGVNPTSADYQSAGCNDSSDNWLRVRFFVLDTGVVEGFACYALDDQQSCTNDGVDTTTPSAGTNSGTTGPVSASGTSAQLATQLLAEWGGNLTGNPGVKSDLTRISQGKTINNSDTCGNTVTIAPDLLQVLLTTTSKYKLFLDNIITGHGCDQFLHPKGRASDIGSVTDLATGKSTNLCAPSSDPSYAPRGCDQSQDSEQLDHDFYIYMASIMPKGSEMGQHTCAGRSDVKAPPGIDFFSDFCDHQHIDLGNK